jgi:hypothetical protein
MKRLSVAARYSRDIDEHEVVQESQRNLMRVGFLLQFQCIVGFFWSRVCVCVCARIDTICIERIDLDVKRIDSEESGPETTENTSNVEQIEWLSL